MDTVMLSEPESVVLQARSGRARSARTGPQGSGAPGTQQGGKEAQRTAPTRRHGPRDLGRERLAGLLRPGSPRAVGGEQLGAVDVQGQADDGERPGGCRGHVISSNVALSMDRVRRSPSAAGTT
ncbi:hypothetical protein GCM10010381_57980 [Streptomyces xantholiticus]|nr:hypothetical protein GCM10010381_57980 [Streptomyces xantholiticus]